MAHSDSKRKQRAGPRVNRLFTDTLVKAERLERMADTIADGALSLAYRSLAADERDKLDFIPKFATVDKSATPELVKAEGELERLEQLSAGASDLGLARGYGALAAEQRGRIKTIRDALD